MEFQLKLSARRIIEMETIAQLTARFANPGKVEWIGIRPGRRSDIVSLSEVSVAMSGLEGDHYQSGGKRAVTLIQQEHLAVIASFLGWSETAPELLRRNIVVSGINLLGLRNRRFRAGTAILEGSGLCAAMAGSRLRLLNQV